MGDATAGRGGDARELKKERRHGIGSKGGVTGRRWTNDEEGSRGTTQAARWAWQLTGSGCTTAEEERS